MPGLSHLSDAGDVRMVDVADRGATVRTATATGKVSTSAAGLISAGTVPKGDVLAVARIAGIMAAKRTAELIPLCHPIAIHGVEMDITVVPEAAEVQLCATVRTVDRTGVEMEALTAVAVAGLAVIDMVKSVDPRAQLRDVAIAAKDGGLGGAWRR